MPIYEYQCKDCGGEFEYQQRMADASKTVCESCGGQLERLISRSSFLLKGSGWYKDLYSSAKPQASASDSSSTAPSSSASSGNEAKSSSAPSSAAAGSAAAGSAD
jgi:putative FmdB family regulatory protein